MLLSNNEIDIDPYAKKGDLYYYLIQKNYKSCADLWDIQDALSRFLKSKNIEIKGTQKYKEQGSLLLKIQPSWLDIPGSYFEFLLEKSNGKKSKELETWLKSEIKKNFKSLKKPPKWLQSPQWPIENNCPLFFIGQIDMSDMRHDTSYAYVFYDEDKKLYKIIEQSA